MHAILNRLSNPARRRAANDTTYTAVAPPSPAVAQVLHNDFGGARKLMPVDWLSLGGADS